MDSPTGLDPESSEDEVLVETPRPTKRATLLFTLLKENGHRQGPSMAECCEIENGDEHGEMKAHRQKRAKLVDLSEDIFRPERPNHCAEGKEYLTRFSLKREIFDQYVCLISRTKHNYVLQCLLCGLTRVDSVGKFIHHFSERSCDLKLVPKENRYGLRDYVAKLAKERVVAYERSSDVAAACRLPDESRLANSKTFMTWINDTASRREYLRQKVARMFLATNQAPLMAEDPFFRDMLADLTGNKISDEDAEAALKRKVLTAEMDDQSKAIVEDAEGVWAMKAKTFGGTHLVDGWAARRGVDAIAASLVALTSSYAVPLVLNGFARNCTTDYVEKLEPLLPWHSIFFTCTDGDSNMIELANLLVEEKFVLPVLCAAQGFSLTLRYIGKVFEGRSAMFTKVEGIIGFFNRNPRRLATLQKEYGSAINFVKFCKTRMTHQTLPLLRVYLLRKAATLAMVDRESEMESEDDTIDVYSKFASVKASLEDDTLFKDIEIFCRATIPVLLAMREADKGVPMAGFVYWLFYHVEVQVDIIMEKLCSERPMFLGLRKQISSAIRFIWDKRHRPVLSLAYLTNPLFHDDLAKEDNVYELDEHFADDVVRTLQCLLKKKYQGFTENHQGEVIDDDFILREAIYTKSELCKYLTNPFTVWQSTEAKTSLAAEFWRSSSIATAYPNLAWCARRIHSMAVVTSQLELSCVGNLQSGKRASLDAERAARYAAAQQVLRRSRNTVDDSTIQRSLLSLVQRCEDLQTEAAIFRFADSDGFDDLNSWVSKLHAENAELLHRQTGSEDARTASLNQEIEGSDPASGLESPGPELIDDLDGAFESREIETFDSGRSTRTRRKHARLDL